MFDTEVQYAVSSLVQTAREAWEESLGRFDMMKGRLKAPTDQLGMFTDKYDIYCIYRPYTDHIQTIHISGMNSS